MLTAVVARPPVFGGKVAKVGRDKLVVEWDLGPNAGLSTEQMTRDFAEQAKAPGTIAKKTGDPESALKTAVKTIPAEYDVPYLAHAMMEPLNCVVDLRADSCEIWTGTQFETVDRANAAHVAGLPPENVQIHTTLLGGGFGRRANPASDFVREAVHVAKVAKAPVKVVWTREDDLQGGWYRPMWHDRFAAGLDANGEPLAWTHTIVDQSIMQGTLLIPPPWKAPRICCTAFPICKWTCTVRRSACRCNGGGQWAIRTRAFRWKRFLTRWRRPAERIPTSCGGNCWPTSRACWRCWTLRRKRPIGERSCRREWAAGSPDISPSTATCRRLWRRR